MDPLVDPGKPALGGGLLGPDWGKDRDESVLLMQVAYAGATAGTTDAKRRRFGVWYAVLDDVVETLKAQFAARGLSAPPFVERALWARVDLATWAVNANEHVELVRALMTDMTEDLGRQVKYRMNNNGNVHLEFSGPTGMGKSSCAIALADWIRPIAAKDLPSHLSFDIGELPGKLRGKKPGETVIQDEYIATAGEGARTVQNVVGNLEDTMRGSQVNLFMVSPQQQEHGTMQARLELLMWNRAEKWSAFLVWIDEKPHGVVGLPWAREELWDAYGPWKAANVQRSLGAQFKDTSYVARQAMQVLEDARIVKYLTVVANKPKKGDFEAALVLFHPQMMSGGQLDRLVDFMHAAAYGFKQLEPYFKEWWGVEPNDGMREVAARCGKA